MPRGRREHHDPLRGVGARRLAQQLDLGGAQGAIEQNRVPGTLRQQGLRHRDIRHHAGLAAPALQPPRHQRSLDALRRHQHDRLAGQIRRGECPLRRPSPSAAASGTDTSKVEPTPGWLSSVMRPPIRLTMRSEMLSPSPVPP